ncbi:sugar ABC transporter substrate-binding protein [Scrofimicrobium sp. R131]|uniref:Sugar ABC transporter substrate-binding protein n=1 Tax=Scrofimicrobium appendicitidis TaxID=3079930 RepID=A0AAU7V7S8_9ACTO
MRRKNLLAATAVATTLTMGLAACSSGGSGNQSDQSSDGGGDSSSSGVTVTWDMWAGSQDDMDWVENTAEIARKENPDITIKTQTSAWNDYFTKLTTNMSSGNLACITSMNGQRLSGFTQALSPLTDEDLATAGLSKDDFTAGSLDIMSYDGTLYGLPYDVAAMLVYYNKDMFEETGTAEPTLDWTFDDFETAAKGTTTDKHKGFGIGMGEFQWMALPIAKSGLQPVNEAGELDLTAQGFVDAATWYGGLVTDQKVAGEVPSASETGWGEQEYNAGNVAMAVDGTWNAASYFANESGFKAGATRLPKGDNGSLGLVLGSGFGIAATCEGAEREAALKVLGSLVGKEAQDLIASSGRSYPARTESQPLYFEALPDGYRAEVKAAFDAGFKDVQGQRTTSNWDQVNTYMQPNLVSVYSGQMTMKDMLDQAQAQFGSK